MLSLEQKKLLSKCKNDKEVKSVFKEIASKEPDRYFPTTELQNLKNVGKRALLGLNPGK